MIAAGYDFFLHHADAGREVPDRGEGRGGRSFGTLQAGRDPFIKRAVAIKTCQSEEQEIKKRFFREAESRETSTTATSRRSTTSASGRRSPYIVQEFLTGDDSTSSIEEE